MYCVAIYSNPKALCAPNYRSAHTNLPSGICFGRWACGGLLFSRLARCLESLVFGRSAIGSEYPPRPSLPRGAHVVERLAACVLCVERWKFGYLGAGFFSVWALDVGFWVLVVWAMPHLIRAVRADRADRGCMAFPIGLSPVLYAAVVEMPDFPSSAKGTGDILDWGFRILNPDGKPSPGILLRLDPSGFLINFLILRRFPNATTPLFSSIYSIYLARRAIPA